MSRVANWQSRPSVVTQSARGKRQVTLFSGVKSCKYRQALYFSQTLLARLSYDDSADVTPRIGFTNYYL